MFRYPSRRTRLLPAFAARALLVAAAIVGASAPATAQVVDVDLDLARLLGVLSGVNPADTTDNRLNVLDGVTRDLLGPNGLLSELNATVLDQGDLLNLQAGELANLTIGLDDLRTSVGLDTADTLRRLTDLRTDVDRHTVRLDGHDLDIEALRRTSLAQSTTILNMGETVTDTSVRVARLEAATGASLSAMHQYSQALDQLATRMTALDGRIDTANEGVAMAMALKSPAVADDKTFAVSGGWGTFEGENAFAMSGAVRANDHLQVDAGLAVGAGNGSIGGRAGATLSW